MIRIDVYTTQGRLREFRVKGHAGYGESGEDIVCAAVSILVYNTINSCERFASTLFEVIDKGDEMICRAPKTVLSERAEVLIQSLFFGIEQLEEQYPEYVKLEYHH